MQRLSRILGHTNTSGLGSLGRDKEPCSTWKAGPTSYTLASSSTVLRLLFGRIDRSRSGARLSTSARTTGRAAAKFSARPPPARDEDELAVSVF